MGQNHIRVYSELKGVEAVLVYDPDPRARQRCQKGVHLVGSPSDLLSVVDLVSICTPTPAHKDVVCVASEMGVPYLVEKPVAGNVGDARVIESLPAPTGSGVGHIERFNLVATTAARFASQPVHMSIRRHNPGSARITDATVVQDLMIHDIDLVRHVFFGRDPDTIVSAVSGDVARTIMTFGESIVSLSASRSSMVKVRDMVIECDAYTVTADLVDQGLYVHWRPDHTVFEDGEYRQEQLMEKIVVPRTEPLRAELAEFVRCVSEGDEFPVTIEQAVQNIELCERIHASGKCNCGNKCHR
jgi:predicted dehydrogenase